MWKKLIRVCLGIMLFCSLGAASVRAAVDPPITVQTPIADVRSMLLQAATYPGKVLKESSGEIITVDDLSVDSTKLGKATDFFYGGTTSALRFQIVLLPVDAGSTRISVSMQLIARYGSPAEGVIATSGSQSGSYLDAYVNSNYINLYRTFNTYYAYGFDVATVKDKIVNIVQTGSPAERAGLKTGDKIIWINGKKATEMKQAEFDRATINPYDPVYLDLSVSRNGETVKISMTSARTKYSLYDQHKQNIGSPF